MAAFITLAQLTARVSESVMLRVLDDNDDGAVDTKVVEQLLVDATSKVRSHIGTIYELSHIAEPAVQEEVVRLTLDVAQAMLAIRFPEAVRVDGYKMMEYADRELKKLREQFTNLGTKAAPEPAATVGGEVGHTATDPDIPCPLFVNGISGFGTSD